MTIASYDVPDSTSATPTYPSARRQWWLVTVVLLTATLGYLDRQMLALLVNPIKADMQLTDTQLSFVIGAAFALSNIVFTLPAGWAVDRVSRRMLLGFGAAVWSTMTAACGLTSNYAQLLLVRAGLGCAESVIQPAAFSMLRSGVAPERRGRAFGIYYMSNMIGTSLALLAGGLLLGVISRTDFSTVPILAQLHPWQIALITVGLVGMPISILLFTVREPARAPVSETLDRTRYSDAIRFVGRHWRFFAPLWTAMVSFVTLTTGMGAWTAAMMGRNYHMTPPEVGFTLGLGMLLASPPGLLMMGWAVDFAGRKADMRGVTVIALLLTFLMWIAAMAIPQSPTATIFIVAITLSFMVSQGPMPAFATLLSSLTPISMMGKISAIQFFLVGLISVAIGPTIVAWLSDSIFAGPNSLSNALSTLGLVCGAITLGALWLLKLHVERTGQRLGQPLS